MLIIEDEWLLADHISQLLEDAGATSFDFADTEDDAVSLARARPPAIIVSDVTLAAGTGPRAVQRIREAGGCGCPVMFVTGSPDTCQPRSDDMLLLTKPIDDSTFRTTFRRLAPVN